MNDKDLFESGCFSPEWTSETPEEPLARVNSPAKFKDKETLLQELREIKQRMQEIRAREWHLAKLLEFHHQQFAKE